MAEVMTRGAVRLSPRRDVHISVPLSREELERLRQKAREAGAESVASFVRTKTLREHA